jgi:oligopeptide/dipeptide ABC transporter ATP-binding protein
MIAAALACEPALLIADEPTTALDVTVQAQVMELLGRLQRERKMGLVLISHDLGLVSEVCEELVVMYAGQVVERGPTKRLLAAPRHPYVAGLLGSTPSLEGEGRLQEIKGTVPDLREPPPGCRFAERCPRVQPSCSAAPVALTPHEEGGEFRCLFPLEAPRG